MTIREIQNNWREKKTNRKRRKAHREIVYVTFAFFVAEIDLQDTRAALSFSSVGFGLSSLADVFASLVADDLNFLGRP